MPGAIIGLEPPKEAYLPIEEPEPETDIDERPDGNAEDDSASSRGYRADSDFEIADGGSPGRRRSNGISRQSRRRPDPPDLFEDATDGSDTQIGGIPYIPQVPTEEEEAEPYDCTPNPATCVGATAPEFYFDFQPQSCDSNTVWTCTRTMSPSLPCCLVSSVNPRLEMNTLELEAGGYPVQMITIIREMRRNSRRSSSTNVPFLTCRIPRTNSCGT